MEINKQQNKQEVETSETFLEILAGRYREYILNKEIRLKRKGFKNEL